jgi:hypothetical protein
VLTRAANERMKFVASGNITCLDKKADCCQNSLSWGIDLMQAVAGQSRTARGLADEYIGSNLTTETPEPMISLNLRSGPRNPVRISSTFSLRFLKCL